MASCRIWNRTTISAILLLLSGCGNSIDSQTADEHGHHDEHEEHLEHFVPAHKPADFEAMVNQLSERLPALAAAWGTGDAEKNATLRSELQDILGWIPELAADSELRRKDFELAVETGTQLTAWFVKNFREGTKQGPDMKPMGPLLESLRKLVPASRTLS